MKEQGTRRKKRVVLKHNARVLAVQGLYQWQFHQGTAEQVYEECLEKDPGNDSDHEYLKFIVMGTVEHMVAIDAALKTVIDRDITSLTPVELAVLRLAVFELMYSLEVPYRVVINEALELVKLFGAQEGYRYINGVLDQLIPSLRAEEIKDRNK